MTLLSTFVFNSKLKDFKKKSALSFGKHNGKEVKVKGKFFPVLLFICPLRHGGVLRE
jgi:hypothetical protein